MNKSLLIEPHFLPSLEYFCAVRPFDKIVLEANEYFIKQTYRNRCYINTANGVKILTVPLAERHGKILTKDVCVESGNRWRNVHWRTIQSAYRKAPFFDYYADELSATLFNGHRFLLDLNLDLLSFCLRHIDFQKSISASVTYEMQSQENVIDLRSVIIVKKPFLLRDYYLPHPYYQVFGNEFVANLSLIDLLFCEGPNTQAIIKASSSSLNK